MKSVKRRKPVTVGLALAACGAATLGGVSPRALASTVPVSSSALWVAQAPSSVPAGDHVKFKVAQGIDASMVGKTLTLNLTPQGGTSLDLGTIFLQYGQGSTWHSLEAQAKKTSQGDRLTYSVLVTQAMVGNKVQAYGYLTGDDVGRVPLGLTGAFTLQGSTLTTTATTVDPQGVLLPPLAQTAFKAPAQGLNSGDYEAFNLGTGVIPQAWLGRSLVWSLPPGTALPDALSLTAGMTSIPGAWTALPKPLVAAQGSTVTASFTVTQAMVGKQVWLYGNASLKPTPLAVASFTASYAVDGVEQGSAVAAVQVPSTVGQSLGSQWGYAVPDISDDAATRAKQLAALKASGTKYVRLDFLLGYNATYTPPTAGQAQGTVAMDFTKFDAVINDVKNAGLEPLVILQTMPESLAALSGGTNVRTGPTTPEQLRAFNLMVQATASHYAGKIHYWEVWNEENSRFFWGGDLYKGRNPKSPAPTAEAYEKLLATVYPTLKQYAPDSTVLSGGTAGDYVYDYTDPATGVTSKIHQALDPVTFIKQYYAAGARPFMDAVALHAYCDASNATLGEFSNLQAYRDAMDAAGDASKPLWITEGGVNLNNDSGGPVSPAVQASLIEQATKAWQGLANHGALIFYTLDAGAGSDNDFGALNSDGSYRPMFSTIQRLAATALTPQ